MIEIIAVEITFLINLEDKIFEIKYNCNLIPEIILSFPFSKLENKRFNLF